MGANLVGQRLAEIGSKLTDIKEAYDRKPSRPSTEPVRGRRSACPAHLCARLPQLHQRGHAHLLCSLHVAEQATIGHSIMMITVRLPKCRMCFIMGGNPVVSHPPKE